MKLEFKNFSGFAECKFYNERYYSYFDEFSYSFNPGVNLLVGQIDDGGWALSYLLDPVIDKHIVIDEGSQIELNGKEASLSDVRKISHALGQSNNTQSCQRQIKKALKNNPFVSESELFEKFELTKERYNRKLSQVGNEIWKITAAIGFSQNKKIFCYPWLSNRYLYQVIHSLEIISKIIKENNQILILPCENTKMLDEFSDIEYTGIDVSWETELKYKLEKEL